jgi:replicative DNA helicase
VNGGVVGFYSLEMSAEQLAARVLSEASEVPSEQIRRGDMTEAEFRRFVEAAKDLEACPLFIDDTAAIPINQLAARARRLKRTHGLDVLFVDYLQLVRPASAKDSRVNEVSEITQGLKAIAKELDIPVVALSQLSRQVESRDDKRPQLSDLRESGSIEQDADVVMFVFREEYYKEREKPGEHELDKMATWQAEMERLTAAPRSSSASSATAPSAPWSSASRAASPASATWPRPGRARSGDPPPRGPLTRRAHGTTRPAAG